MPTVPVAGPAPVSALASQQLDYLSRGSGNVESANAILTAPYHQAWATP